MLIEFTQGFVAFMTRARKPGCECNYGINVTDVSDGTTIWLTFTFQSGHRYCCSTSSCHHGLLFDCDYQRLRDCFRQAGVDVAKPMRIKMKVVWERGALFAVNPGVRHPEYEPNIERCSREEVYDEQRAEISAAQS
jgi:hypothetical protein